MISVTPHEIVIIYLWLGTDKRRPNQLILVSTSSPIERVDASCSLILNNPYRNLLWFYCEYLLNTGSSKIVIFINEL